MYSNHTAFINISASLISLAVYALDFGSIT
jgi:hypothetical protein